MGIGPKLGLPLCFFFFFFTFRSFRFIAAFKKQKERRIYKKLKKSVPLWDMFFTWKDVWYQWLFNGLTLEQQLFDVVRDIILWADSAKEMLLQKEYVYIVKLWSCALNRAFEAEASLFSSSRCENQMNASAIAFFGVFRI